MIFLLPSWVALGKGLTLSEPQFPPLSVTYKVKVPGTVQQVLDSCFLFSLLQWAPRAQGGCETLRLSVGAERLWYGELQAPG